MKNNINCTTKMGNTCKENNVNDEMIKAFSEIIDSFIKKDRCRKIREKSKKTASPTKNYTNNEIVEAIQKAIKQSFTEDTRRKTNWNAREKRAKAFRLENPLAIQ